MSLNELVNRHETAANPDCQGAIVDRGHYYFGPKKVLWGVDANDWD